MDLWNPVGQDFKPSSIFSPQSLLSRKDRTLSALIMAIQVNSLGSGQTSDLWRPEGVFSSLSHIVLVFKPSFVCLSVCVPVFVALAVALGVG